MDNILFNNVTTILSSLSSVAIIISAFFWVAGIHLTIYFLSPCHFIISESISQILSTLINNSLEGRSIAIKVVIYILFSLNKNQFLVIQYQVDRTLCNSQVQAYLFNLYHWSKRTGIPMPFSYLVKYGLREGYLRKGFRNVNSQSYKHYLNI